MNRVLLVMTFLLFADLVLAGNVTTSNKGQPGQVLVNNGAVGGHHGTWVNQLGQDKGPSDEIKLAPAIRLLDTKKTTTELKYSRDVRNDNNAVELKFTWKFGESYTDKKIKEFEKRLVDLEGR